jgi:hypothetical protein
MAAPTPIGLSAFMPKARKPSAMRFLFFLIAAGLLNSLIAAFLFLRLPDSHAPSLTSLLIRAMLFVVIGALAGVAGAGFYWRNSSSPFRDNPPIAFRLFALVCAGGWLWVPAIVLMSREDSPITAPIAVLAAALLAAGLRAAIPSAALVLLPHAAQPEADCRELFAATLRSPRIEAHGYLIALGVYAAAYEFFNGWILSASSLLAACAFFFAWKRTPEPSGAFNNRQQTLRAARRLAYILLPAILVTLFALLYGIEHRNHLVAIAAQARNSADSREDDAPQNAQTQKQPASNALSGYHSIILWPPPEKKQIVAPLPQPVSLLAPGDTKPLVIRFDGPYWYFQPPRKGPSPAAHQAHGTPLAIDIQTNNFISLIMEAHQSLGSAIPLARCREIQVGILSRDNRRGAINLAVLLTDSSSPGRTQLYLGQQPVLSSQPEHFSVKSSPVGETLSFAIPASAKIRKFDEITVMFFPDAANYDIGPKIAIEQFQLIPR